MRNKRILIFGSYNYCGGTIVLAELCRILIMKGYNACLVPTDYYPTDKQSSTIFLRTLWHYNLKIVFKLCLCRLLPFKRVKHRFTYDKYHPRHLRRCRVKWLPIFSKERTIVVYPEYLYGNPLKAKHVVRWVLFNYRFWGDSNAYSNTDLFIGYREQFVKDAPFKDLPIVTISSYDFTLYRRTNFGPREGKCYIVRKGSNRPDLPDIFDGPVIDDLPEEEKVEIFNQSEFCYSYDTQTAYSEIASLCGCISIVVMEPGKTVSYYRSKGDSIYGVAFGDDQLEIERAIATRPMLEDGMKKRQDENLITVDRLVNLVEGYFKCALL